MSELLCEAVDVRWGERVLDVATGTGNTAIAAARRGADVTGVDFVPSLLGSARTRATAEGLALSLVGGDAEALPHPDSTFDVVLSTFGVMFVPDQARAAAELLRVCRPGGRIGIASFTPDSLAARFALAASRRVPPPRGLRSPMRWGTDNGLRALFGDGVAIRAQRRTIRFRRRDPAHAVGFFRSHFGPVREAFGALDEQGRLALEADLADLVERANVSNDQTVVAPFEYLEAVLALP